MDTVLFLLHIRGLKPLLVFYFRVEEKFVGRKISREDNFAKFHSHWILFSREENFAQNQNSRKYRKFTPREELVLYSMPPISTPVGIV